MTVNNKIISMTFVTFSFVVARTAEQLFEGLVARTVTQLFEGEKGRLCHRNKK